MWDYDLRKDSSFGMRHRRSIIESSFQIVVSSGTRTKQARFRPRGHVRSGRNVPMNRQ